MQPSPSTPHKIAKKSAPRQYLNADFSFSYQNVTFFIFSAPQKPECQFVLEMGGFKDRGWFATMFVLEKGGFRDKLDRE